MLLSRQVTGVPSAMPLWTCTQGDIKLVNIDAPLLRKTKGPTDKSAGPESFLAIYFEEVTSECVMACTDSAIRFCTPTLRISLATCAFTVRSSMPSADPISLLERPATSISRTSFSRSVKVTRPAGKILPGDVLTRSINNDNTRRGAQTDPW